jgi:hypothetical protein
MNTEKSKPSSSGDDAHAASGQRPALRYRSEPNSAENSEEDAGFSGTCENTSLSDWIQLVQMNRRDAVIGIKRHDGKKALLWCRDGDIIDAWCDGVIGEDAVYRALTWEGGQVSVAFAPFEHERQIEIATPALLLRAAYRKDSGVRELRPEAHAPSSPAPAPSLHESSEAAASSPATANSVVKASVPAPAPLAEPAAATSPRRRIRKRAWLLGIALGLLPLLALTASWGVTPKTSVSLPAPARKMSTHADPSRAEVTPSAPAAVITAREEGPVPHSAPTAARPPGPVGKARWAPAPRQAVAPPKAPLPAATKPENKTTPNAQTIGIRAPRVQIIDERESKIEVIE